MLRLYFLRQWYHLADEALEDMLYDSAALRSFASIDLAREAAPDATTLMKFRHLLEKHELTRKLFDEIGIMLCERGLLMKEDTIVDATIIATPASTKNEAQSRDPEMHYTKKNRQWHLGMKAHIGIDAHSGMVHRASWARQPTHPRSRKRTRCCTVMKRLPSAMWGTQAWTSATR
jgi:transposase, IS5 family